MSRIQAFQRLNDSYTQNWKEIVIIIICAIIVSWLNAFDIMASHTLVEMFSILIACGTFLIVVNVPPSVENQFFIFLGIAFGFVGIFNTLHCFAFLGDAFGQSNMNTSMQFWLVGLSMQSVSLLIACLFFTKTHKKVNYLIIVTVYCVVTILFVLCITSNILPQSYVEGQRYTIFKRAFEGVNVAVVCCTLALFIRVKLQLDAAVYKYMKLFLIFTILSDATFAALAKVADPFFVLAHILKLVSFLYLYKAIVETGIRYPNRLLFHQLSAAANMIHEREEALRISNQRFLKEQDIRKQMEENMLKNEQCYQLLIENSKDAIFIHRKNKLVYVNEAAAELIGYKNKHELKSRDIMNFLLPAYKTMVNERQKIVFESKGSVPPAEIQIVKADGTVLTVETESTYFTYHGKPSILNILRDMTDKKQLKILEKDIEEKDKMLDETLEYSKNLTEYFTNISHELRTPLNVMMAGVQVLSVMLKAPDEKVQEYLRIIKQNNYRLLRLINNVLDLSKVEAGFLQLHLQNANIINIIEEITLSVAHFIQDKGTQLIFDTELEEVITACDLDMVEKVMLNLLSNAVKYTKPGDEISVYIKQLGEKIDISVKDTGVGIPEEKQKEIFERFRQVDTSLRRSREGTGIGLSLVKSLVALHGGSIRLKSKIGEGSEFIVSLPIKLLQEDNSEHERRWESQESTERVSIEFSDIYELSK